MNFLKGTVISFSLYILNGVSITVESITPSIIKKDFFGGFYAGIGAGACHTNAEVTSYYSGQHSDHISLSGWDGVGNVSFGVERTFSEKFYVALQGGTQIGMGRKSAKTLEDDDIGNNYWIKEKFVYEIALKVGWLWTPEFLVYVKGGACKGWWEAQIDYQANSTLKKTSSLYGAILGIGVEHSVTSLWRAGLSINHSFYKRLKLQDAPQYFAWTIKPSSTQVLLSMIYRFC